ncbi:MAG TPA: matrixin family metalloprotease [Pyrinomonadaceae bacterium]|nr:matrixin family metalloprotease [Pyrinomonadaceae bacterium]
MRRPNSILALVAVLAFVVSARPSSFDMPAPAQEKPIKWPSRTIQIAVSSSLTESSPAVKPDSDVLGALRRALASWSRAANITFITVASKRESVSPQGKGDGVSLITIAPTTENVELFSEGNTTARTRVFFDEKTGDITEADIVINPYPYSENGNGLQFSTDGTSGTYDLESTFAHEIGHLLGLTHSRVIGATMQATQALNGTYGLPAVTERSLSDADVEAVRSLYGLREGTGAIEGRVFMNVDGGLQPATAAHIWIEDVDTGNVMAAGQTDSGGRFSISSVVPGNYRALVEYIERPVTTEEALTSRRPAKRERAFRSVEMRSRLNVTADQITIFNYTLVPPQNAPPAVNARFIGANGDLSTVPVPLVPGQKVLLYVGGDGVDQVPGSGLVLSSPFLTIDPSTLTLERSLGSTPVISFEVSVAPNAPAGDYTLRLQANSGELTYFVGGITINPTR